MKNVINKNTAVNLMTTIPLILDKPSRISHIENDHHLKFELLALKGIAQPPTPPPADCAKNRH